MAKSVFQKMMALYQNYIRHEEEAEKMLKDSMLSGDYSTRKIKELQTGVSETNKRNRAVLEEQYKELRSQYEHDLLMSEDFTALSNADSAALTPLVRILQSGIDFSAREYERMALKYQGSRVASRLLHDDAKRHGLELSNMADIDTKMSEFDRISDRLVRAANQTDNNVTRAMLADIDIEKVESELETPSCICTPLGNDFNSISQRVTREMMASGGGVSLAAAEAAFLKGFVGEDKAAALAEIEKDATDPERMRFDSADAGVQALALQFAKLKSLHPTLGDAMDSAERVISDIEKAKEEKENG